MRKGLATLAVAVLLGGCGGEDPERPAAGSPEAEAAPVPAALPALPLDSALEFTGMMTYLADAAAFTDCASGSVFPLAMEAAYASLERAYLDARPGPGDPVLVAVVGRVAIRAGVDGRERRALVAERLLRVSPGAGCGETAVDRPLERTRWVALAADGASPPPGTNATLVLDPDAGTVGGSTGCGVWSGSYGLAGGRLDLAVTGVEPTAACGPEALGWEGRYLEALRLAGSYRLRGDTLLLLGEAGPVARFLAR